MVDLSNPTLKARTEALCERQVPYLMKEWNEEFGELLKLLVCHAAQYWDYEGVNPHDFCIRDNILEQGFIVFGADNTLIWSLIWGFKPDRNNCSPEFLANYDTLKTKETL